MVQDNQFVKNLLGESRKRCVGSLMAYVEMNVYPHLPLEDRKALRDKVLMAVGAYHDNCLDVLKASVSDGMITNQYLLEAIEDLHTKFDRNV